MSKLKLTFIQNHHRQVMSELVHSRHIWIFVEYYWHVKLPSHRFKRIINPTLLYFIFKHDRGSNKYNCINLKSVSYCDNSIKKTPTGNSVHDTAHVSDFRSLNKPKLVRFKSKVDILYEIFIKRNILNSENSQYCFSIIKKVQFS
jgi:hypothetical protein